MTCTKKSTMCDKANFEIDIINNQKLMQKFKNSSKVICEKWTVCGAMWVAVLWTFLIAMNDIMRATGHHRHTQ